LVRDGRTIPLRPKTWGVLLYLAQRPGMLVSKDELLDVVWPDVAVTPDTLTKSIGELRAALGDDAKTPTCIETVHRRGFRFIARPPGAGSKSSVSAFEQSQIVSQGPGSEDRHAGTDVFVGRRAELGQLETLFARACAGERQIVSVTGGAGAGKTALVETFLRSLPAGRTPRPLWIGRGTCVDQHGSREA
jgi:DNA-binding winged helix-turn-helix (wHTH) protein